MRVVFFLRDLCIMFVEAFLHVCQEYRFDTLSNDYCFTILLRSAIQTVYKAVNDIGFREVLNDKREI